MKPLAGKVAWVAGATRGAGRGIARMLGEAGATVYCSGRSSHTQPNTSNHHYAGRPETIEETAELVTAAGGQGIAFRADHNVESDVAAVAQKIAADHQKLDLLVNVLTGEPIHLLTGTFATQPSSRCRDFFDSWIWSHVTTAWHAVQLMRPNRSGLLVELVEHAHLPYHSHFYLDFMEIALKRLSHTLACDLKPDGISAICVAPGFMRTEAILEHFGVTEQNWRDALRNDEPRKFGWQGSETPCFTGRAVAALAADPNIASKSGGIFSTWDLSREYGFTDIDGSLPEHHILDAAMKAYFDELPPGPNFTWNVRQSTTNP
ncbi:MAG: SDR family oxidoreductase [Bryobacteraceae bacterium]